MHDGVATLFLTKLLPAFVYPLGLAIWLLILSGVLAVLDRRRPAILCTMLAVSGLWIASLPPFAEWALGTLERQYPARALADLPEADVAIVLGGALGARVHPRVTVDLTASSDRVLQAARLYRAGKVKRVLVTGGNTPWLPGEEPESELIRDLLIEWGVPADAISTAGASRNTYENALEIRAMREQKPFGSALLVTSAAHMPRSMAIFKRVGIQVSAATTDVEVVSSSPWTPLRMLPDAGALAMSTAAMKEWMGFYAYCAREFL